MQLSIICEPAEFFTEEGRPMSGGCQAIHRGRSGGDGAITACEDSRTKAGILEEVCSEKDLWEEFLHEDEGQTRRLMI
ncbi:MAG: hypothetical protein IJT02_03170 [Synergistaceae bacterium]|nr:hypothetical protein [Synergistaceae bacterium]